MSDALVGGVVGGAASSCARSSGGCMQRFVARLDERDRTFFRARFEEQRTQVEAGEAVPALAHAEPHARKEAARALPRSSCRRTDISKPTATTATTVKAHERALHMSHERYISLIDEMIVGDVAAERLAGAARAPARLRAVPRPLRPRRAGRAHASRRAGGAGQAFAGFVRSHRRGGARRAVARPPAWQRALQWFAPTQRWAIGLAAAAAVAVLIPFSGTLTVGARAREFQVRGARHHTNETAGLRAFCIGADGRHSTGRARRASCALNSSPTAASSSASSSSASTTTAPKWYAPRPPESSRCPRPTASTRRSAPAVQARRQPRPRQGADLRAVLRHARAAPEIEAAAERMASRIATRQDRDAAACCAPTCYRRSLLESTSSHENERRARS